MAEDNHDFPIVSVKQEQELSSDYLNNGGTDVGLEPKPENELSTCNGQVVSCDGDREIQIKVEQDDTEQNDDGINGNGYLIKQDVHNQLVVFHKENAYG